MILSQRLLPEPGPMFCKGHKRSQHEALQEGIQHTEAAAEVPQVDARASEGPWVTKGIIRKQSLLFLRNQRQTKLAKTPSLKHTWNRDLTAGRLNHCHPGHVRPGQSGSRELQTRMPCISAEWPTWAAGQPASSHQSLHPGEPWRAGGQSCHRLRTGGRQGARGVPSLSLGTWSGRVW